MDVYESIIKRRSVRQFKPQPIPRKILSILEDALIWAPSAGNLQSRRFFFVFDPRIKRRLAQAALGQEFIAQAPLTIVGCADSRITRHYGSRGGDLYALQDVAASIENLLLVACELGLATCWVGAFREEEASQILNLPPYLRPVSLVPIGYPAEDPPPPPRLSKGEAITYLPAPPKREQAGESDD